MGPIWLDPIRRAVSSLYGLEVRWMLRFLPKKDGTPAIDRDGEPVIGVVDGTVAKAYSTWLLNGHEVVNDTINSRPIGSP